MAEELKEIEPERLWQIFNNQEGKKDIYEKEDEDEVDLAEDDDVQQFKVKEAYMKFKEKEIKFKIRNVFIEPTTSEFIAFGHKGEFQFKIEGSLYGTGEFDLDLVCEEKKITMTMVGEIERKDRNDDFVFTYREDGYKLKFKLDLNPWKGTFDQEGKPKETRVSINVNAENEIVGISRDEAGVAIWKGKIKADKVLMKKQYILSHFIKYAGTINKEALPTIAGKWEINGNTDDFTITKQAEKPKEPKEPEKKKEKPKKKKVDNKAKKEEKKKQGKPRPKPKLKGKAKDKKKQKKGGKKRDVFDSDDDEKKGVKKPVVQKIHTQPQAQPNVVIQIQQPQQQEFQQYNPGFQQQQQHQVNPQPFPQQTYQQQQNQQRPVQQVHANQTGCCNIF